MKEILRYIDADSMKSSSTWYIFEPMSSGNFKYFQSILNDYLTAPKEDVQNDKDFRYAHVDMYHMCILSESVPERLKLGNSLHPGGVYFSGEDKDYLKSYFLEKRDVIIKKILELAPTEEDFKRILETLD